LQNENQETQLSQGIDASAPEDVIPPPHYMGYHAKLDTVGPTLGAYIGGTGSNDSSKKWPVWPAFNSN